ncbi:ABC transporter substrate-binding protein [Robbsia sp. KACC 23696]|uniref:ABC transporter substrate-binding protein n=1 Tax=Robbsia sp. KACC 23696 TaxID=3149231 RepID=UPI00325ABD3B
MATQTDKLLSRRRTLASLMAGALSVTAGRVFAANEMAGMDMSGAPFPELGPLPPRPASLRKVTLAWNENAICTAAIPVAIKKGIFARYGLDVDFVNYSGSTDQLLESIATGKADGAVGMALRWLKPLDQGFDVKLVAGLHGGCMRLLSAQNGGVKSLSDLKGKTIGTSDLASPDKAFFSILLQQAGLNPDADVTWRAFPGDLLPVALQRGEVGAICGGDPLAWEFRKQHNLHEVANNMQGQYAHRTCCVVGIRGQLLRKEPYIANALVRSILEGGRVVGEQPAEAAAIFSQYAPKVPVADLTAMLREHAHHDQQIGTVFQGQIAAYAQDLKSIGVFSDGLNAQKFAQRVTSDPFKTA